MLALPIQQLQFLDKYSRFDYSKGRRETWEESVERSVNHLRHMVGDALIPSDVFDDIKEAMLTTNVFPSMRLFAMAGEAAIRDNASIYNCCYLPIDDPESFCEVLALSMSGCGVGFSVEAREVNKLPVVCDFPDEIKQDCPVVFEDSTEGWVNGFRKCIEHWFNGEIVSADVSKIRPKGTPLKIKGGRASGSDQLIELIEFCEDIFINASGRKLTPIEVFDLVTKIGETIVSGGVRRTALICLFDYDDHDMLHAKYGEFWKHSPHRAMANISAVWPKYITPGYIDEFVNTMHNSGTGEPGIFVRENVTVTSPRRKFREDEFAGTNPCGEVYLRPRGFCNLSQVICKPSDDVLSLIRKVKLATIIGTIQSTATYFPYLKRPEWVRNCEEERLLGVDLDGQWDCPVVRDPQVLELLRNVAIETNKEYAALLGINQSVAVTCVKPSGNSSVLFNCSPGIHTSWSPYYLRRIRLDDESPVAKLVEMCGIRLEKNEFESGKVIAVFPMKARDPDNFPHLSALDQLDYWRMNKVYYTEHNPSVTITYQPEELNDIKWWLYENREIVGGLTFLLRDDHIYDYAPYEKITRGQYEFHPAPPNIEMEWIRYFEHEDNTNVAGELACFAGGCA